MNNIFDTLVYASTIRYSVAGSYVLLYRKLEVTGLKVLKLFNYYDDVSHVQMACHASRQYGLF